MPIVIATALWRVQWRGKAIQCRMDSAAVIAIVNSGRSKQSDLANHLMRTLVFIKARFNIVLYAIHLPGKQNEAADALSRDNLPLFFEQVPQAEKKTTAVPPGTVRTANAPSTRLDLGRLEESMCVYFSKGIAASKQPTYKSGKNQLCEKASVTPLPVCEKQLCSFVAHLANEGLKFRTIKVCLSAIRHLQIEAGMSDPFKESMPRLEYVTKGIKKHEAEKGVRERPRLLITPLLLLKMKAVWEASAASFDTKMLWAASCLCSSCS